MATTNLTTARDVIALYDKRLDHCCTAEDLKDIVNMRILAVAQVDAAGALKMNTSKRRIYHNINIINCLKK